jgi:hypothetical protein
MEASLAKGALMKVAADIIKARFAKTSQVRDLNGDFTGTRLVELLNFDMLDVPNLYSVNLSTKLFTFHYSEHEHVARATGRLTAEDPLFSAHFFPNAHVEAGINYLGQVEVIHISGEVYRINVPGERTYDPAGVTGSQINSERIEGAYFCFMVGVLVSQIRAAQFGASQRFIEEVSRVTKPLLEDYYQRFQLHSWMCLQVTQACCLKRTPSKYGEYLKTKVFEKALQLKGDRSDHTKEYLEQFLACEEGEVLQIYPPRQYFRKLCQDDEAELQGELPAVDFAKVKKVAGQYFSEIVLKLLPKLTPGSVDADNTTTEDIRHRCLLLSQKLERHLTQLTGAQVSLQDSLPPLFK